MRRRGNKQVDEADVDMTPMLDIVFIMLIFFIVTATFLDEHGKDFTQPPPPPEQDDVEPKPAIVIFVSNDDSCSVDGFTSDCGNVRLAVEKQLAIKANASAILRISEGARHKTMVQIRDDLDSSGMDVKLEIIRS